MEKLQGTHVFLGELGRPAEIVYLVFLAGFRGVLFYLSLAYTLK